MDADRHRHLGIFLNDHLAGAAGGVGRARAARDANESTEFFEPLAAVCREIEEDRSSLESLMDDLGIGRSRVKELLLGITGKLRLWTLLGDLLDGETSRDLPALARRAEDQRTRVGELQDRAARLL